MNLPILGSAIDERFLDHRLRATSLAGLIGGIVAILLFGYHYYVNHVWSWDLFTVAITIVTVKLTVLAWYRLTD
jgi:hypothetical protein